MAHEAVSLSKEMESVSPYSISASPINDSSIPFLSFNSNRRWIVLTKTHLYSFKVERNYKNPTECIPIKDFLKLRPADEELKMENAIVRIIRFRDLGLNRLHRESTHQRVSYIFKPPHQRRGRNGLDLWVRPTIFEIRGKQTFISI